MEKKRSSVLPLIIILIIVFFADYISPNNPYIMNRSDILSPPSLKFFFGTDQFGRCIFSRALYGVRTSVIFSILGTLISHFIGLLLGSMAGFLGNKIDKIIMRLSDIILAFPGLVLSLAIVGILGPGIKNTFIALVFPRIFSFCKLVRGLTFLEKEKDYIKSSFLSGNNIFRTMFFHIVPNINNQLINFSVSKIGAFILALSGLSFIGLGIQPPYPELGTMINESLGFMQLAPHIFIFPGLILTFTIYAFNDFSDYILYNPSLNLKFNLRKEYLKYKINKRG